MVEGTPPNPLPRAAGEATSAGDRAEAMIRAARSAVVTCARCGAVCPEPGARFCSSCGAALTAPAQSETAL